MSQVQAMTPNIQAETEKAPDECTVLLDWDCGD